MCSQWDGTCGITAGQSALKLMNLRETNMTFTDVESRERESMRGWDKAKRKTGLADLWETR